MFKLLGRFFTRTHEPSGIMGNDYSRGDPHISTSRTREERENSEAAAIERDIGRTIREIKGNRAAIRELIFQDEIASVLRDIVPYYTDYKLSNEPRTNESYAIINIDGKIYSSGIFMDNKTYLKLLEEELETTTDDRKKIQHIASESYTQQENESHYFEYPSSYRDDIESNKYNIIPLRRTINRLMRNSILMDNLKATDYDMWVHYRVNYPVSRTSHLPRTTPRVNSEKWIESNALASELEKTRKDLEYLEEYLEDLELKLQDSSLENIVL